jgi:hypothetical protein
MIDEDDRVRQNLDDEVDQGEQQHESYDAASDCECGD